LDENNNYSFQLKLASLLVCTYPASIQLSNDSFHQQHIGKNTSLKISMQRLLP